MGKTYYSVYKNSTGNVGVGTVSPANNLVVYNPSSWAGEDLNGSSGGELRFLQSGTLKANIYASTSTGFVINGGSETIFQIGASEKMRLTGGNLGIGTTSPSSLLNVSGTGTLGSVFQEKITNGTTTLALGTNATAAEVQSQGSVPLYLNYGGNNVCVVPVGSGNVGIGTTSPTSKLHIVGDSTFNGQISSTGAMAIGMTPAPFWNARFTDYSDGSGVYIGSVQAGGYKYISGESYYNNSSFWQSNKTTSTAIGLGDGILRFYTDSGLTANTNFIPSERMRITVGGNVGIGTSSPTQALHITSTNSGNNGLTIATTSATGNPQVRFLNSAGAEKAAITYASSADSVYFYTAASASNLLNFVGSNIGIGTTSPAYKLEVIGAIRASSTHYNTNGDLNALRGSLTTMGYNLTNSPSGAGWITVMTSQCYIAGGDIASQIAYDNYNQQKLFTRYSSDFGATWSAWKTIINSDALSGTSNYVPKFTGTNSIGNGTIYDNGNIGIGTTSPAAKLDIYGSVSVRGTRVLTTGFDIFGGLTYDIYGNIRVLRSDSAQADGMYIGYGGSGGPLRFFSNSGTTEFMTIATTGNVGIGTTSPAAKLDVIGSIRYSSNGNPVTEYAGIITTPNDYPTCTEKARIYTIGTVNANGDNSSYLEVEVIGSHRGYTVESYYEYKRWIITVGDRISSRLVFSSGRDLVGLWNGTDATGFKGQNGAPDLANGAVIKLIANPNCGAGLFYTVRVKYANLNLTQGPFTYTNHSVYSVTIPSSQYHLYGDTVVLASNSGNVGIGTTSPSTKLHVVGNAEIGDSTADTGIIVRHGAGSAQYGRIRFYDSNGLNVNTIHSFPTAWQGGTFLNSSAGALNLTGYNGVTFGAWNNVDVAFALGGNNYFKGNVGIGTTTPFGTAANRTVLSVNGTTDVSLNIGSGGSQRAYLYGVSTYAELGTIGSLPLTFAPNNSEKMRLNVDGNVGIGTTSPSQKLELNGTSTAIRILSTTGDAYVRLTDNGVRNWDLKVVDVNDYFEVGGTNTTSLVVTGAGNVGIGTTSPSSLLHVYGTTPTIKVQGSSTNSAKVDLIGTYTTWSLENQYVNGATNDMFRIYNSSLSADAITINRSTNNVGIGTTSPKQKLDVSGAGGKIAITNTGTTDYSELVFYEGSSVKADIWVNGSTQATYAGVNSMNIWQGSNAPMAFYTNGTNERMRIAADGNVGIGTSSPVQKLSVVGNIYLPQGNYITWNNGDCDIGGIFGYHLVFRTYTGVSMTEKLRIQSDGNVGIGTTIPLYKLDVNGSVNANNIRTTTQIGGTIGTIQSFVTPGIYSNGSSTGNAIAISSNTTFGNQGAWANLGLHQTTANANDLTAKVYLAIGGWYQNSGTGIPVYIGGGFSSNSSSVLSVVPVDAAGNGNVGIGTTSPSTKLEVVGGEIKAGRVDSTNEGGQVSFGRASDNTTAWYIDAFGSTSTPSLRFVDTTATVRLILTGAGDVGIGVTPSYKLDVNGNIHGTGFPTSSDVRFKKNITPLQNSLEKIKKLQGVKYEWNEFVNSRRDGYKLNIPIIGLIAQDVEQVVPEIVDHWKLSEDCQDARSIDYPRLIPLLIEAMKEQQNQIEELRNEIKSLKSN